MADFLRIKLKTLDNKVTEISVPREIPVLEIKKMIQQLMEIEIDSQKLIYKGKQLTNSQKLSDHITINDEIIHVMGGKPKPKTEESNIIDNNPITQSQIPNNQSQIPTKNSQSSTKNSNQAPKMDFGSLFNSVMQNPAIMQMATQIATNQQPLIGSKTDGNPFANLMGILGGPNNSNNLGIEEENKKEKTQKKTMTLPFKNIQNLSKIADTLMGENSTFPGPSRPQLNYERNNLSILGGYINKLYFNLLRILPFVGRLGDLFERESLIVNEKDRQDMETLSHNVALAFAELQKSIEPVTSILENVKIGKNPGESLIRECFKIEESKDTTNSLDTTNKESVIGNDKSNDKQLKTKNPQMDFNSILSEMTKGDNMKNMMNLVGNMLNKNEDQDLGGMMNMLGPMMSQLTGGNKGGDNLINMMGGGQPIKQKLNNDCKLKDILNDMIEEDDSITEDVFLELLMELTLNEIIKISNGNFDSISKLRPQLKNFVLNKNKTNDELSEIYAKFHCSKFNLPSQLKDKLIPNFNLTTNMEEIFKKHYFSFVTLFMNDSLSDSEFSIQFKVYLTLLIGEALSNLSTGFSNDKEIAKQFIKMNLEKIVLDSYEEMGYVLKSIGGVNSLMKLITETYEIYLKEKESLLKNVQSKSTSIDITWEQIMNFTEMDANRQGELNKKLEGEKGNKDFFSDYYKGTYAYK